jgi:hypothetical protein
MRGPKPGVRLFRILNDFRAGKRGVRHTFDSTDGSGMYGTLCGKWFKNTSIKRIAPKEWNKAGLRCGKCRELCKGLRVAAILMDGLPRTVKA